MSILLSFGVVLKRSGENHLDIPLLLMESAVQTIFPVYFVRNIIYYITVYHLTLDRWQHINSDLNDSITDHCNTSGDKHHANLQLKCDTHSILVDVLDAVKNIKRGKHDGNSGYLSDHIINSSPRVYVQLSLLFSSMLSHGYVSCYQH